MERASLSDIELYFTAEKIENGLIKIKGEEYHHIKDVMRHKTGDVVFVTDGNGKIFETGITEISQNGITCFIQSTLEYENKFPNVFYCLPRLKSADRFEFALEKCVELGITNFIVFESERTIAKGAKLERWQKILLAAMKQSLRAWLPKIEFVKRYEDLFKRNGTKIIFEQNSKTDFKKITSAKLNEGNSYFIFGPEGGLSNSEIKTGENIISVKLTESRLRAETAIITSASLLNQFHS